MCKELYTATRFPQTTDTILVLSDAWNGPQM